MKVGMNRSVVALGTLALMLAVLCLSSIGDPSHMEELKKEGQKEVDRLLSDIQAKYNAMLSNDVEKAKKALDFFYEKKATGIVKIALRHNIPTVKCHAAQKLGMLKDESALPELLRALKDSKFYHGGTEAKMVVEKVLKSVVGAIGETIGRDFHKLDVNDPVHMKTVVLWTERHMKKTKK